MRYIGPAKFELQGRFANRYKQLARLIYGQAAFWHNATGVTAFRQRFFLLDQTRIEVINTGVEVLLRIDTTDVVRPEVLSGSFVFIPRSNAGLVYGIVVVFDEEGAYEDVIYYNKDAPPASYLPATSFYIEYTEREDWQRGTLDWQAAGLPALSWNDYHQNRYAASSSDSGGVTPNYAEKVSLSALNRTSYADTAWNKRLNPFAAHPSVPWNVWERSNNRLRLMGTTVSDSGGLVTITIPRARAYLNSDIDKYGLPVNFGRVYCRGKVVLDLGLRTILGAALARDQDTTYLVVHLLPADFMAYRFSIGDNQVSLINPIKFNLIGDFPVSSRITGATRFSANGLRAVNQMLAADGLRAADFALDFGSRTVTVTQGEFLWEYTINPATITTPLCWSRDFWLVGSQTNPDETIEFLAEAFEEKEPYIASATEAGGFYPEIRYRKPDSFTPVSIRGNTLKFPILDGPDVQYYPSMGPRRFSLASGYFPHYFYERYDLNDGWGATFTSRQVDYRGNERIVGELQAKVTYTSTFTEHFSTQHASSTFLPNSGVAVSSRLSAMNIESHSCVSNWEITYKIDGETKLTDTFGCNTDYTYTWPVLGPSTQVWGRTPAVLVESPLQSYAPPVYYPPNGQLDTFPTDPDVSVHFLRYIDEFLAINDDLITGSQQWHLFRYLGLQAVDLRSEFFVYERSGFFATIDYTRPDLYVVQDQSLEFNNNHPMYPLASGAGGNNVWWLDGQPSAVRRLPAQIKAESRVITSEGYDRLFEKDLPDVEQSVRQYLQAPLPDYNDLSRQAMLQVPLDGENAGLLNENTYNFVSRGPGSLTAYKWRSWKARTITGPFGIISDSFIDLFLIPKHLEYYRGYVTPLDINPDARTVWSSWYNYGSYATYEDPVFGTKLPVSTSYLNIYSRKPYSYTPRFEETTSNVPPLLTTSSSSATNLFQGWTTTLFLDDTSNTLQSATYSQASLPDEFNQFCMNFDPLFYTAVNAESLSGWNVSAVSILMGDQWVTYYVTQAPLTMAPLYDEQELEQLSNPAFPEPFFSLGVA